MGYSAGNLELSILGFSEKAVASIDVTAKALRRLASAVDKINNTQFVFAGQKLEVLFTKIAKATNSINTTNITNLASAAKSLSSISRLSNLDKMDFAKVGKGFETLSTAIQPFLNKVKEAEASLTSLDGILRRSSGKKIQGLLDGGDSKGNRSSNGVFSFAKRFASIYMLRRMGRFMGDLVQAGSDYYETLNLWQVAMRNNLDTADQFINKMNKAYGISTKTLMNAQAIFKNMIGSLGQISDETAYALSEALVQMSADFASLYNVQLERAFEKMQSMLAGQVRPIRSAGLDMTETTLFMFYQQLGGTKTMRQLTRTEKQLLSILAVYKQMGSAGALGDMTKTLNTFANQSRMIVENFKELKTWVGLLLKDFVEQTGLLTYLNAGLITITEIVKSIASSKNIGKDNFIDGLFETTEATNEEIDELQGKLLDFDKFRALQSSEENVFGIDEKLLEAISGYSSNLDSANNKAQDLAKTWLENLGYIYDAESGVWKIGENVSWIVKIFQRAEEHTKTFTDTITNTIEEIKPEIKKAIQFLEPIFDSIFDIAEQAFPVIKNLIVKLAPALTPVFKIINTILKIVIEINNVLNEVFMAVGDSLEGLPYVLEIVSVIAEDLLPVIVTLLKVINVLLSPILLIFEAINKLINELLRKLSLLFQGDWDTLWNERFSNPFGDGEWSSPLIKDFSKRVDEASKVFDNFDEGFGKIKNLFTNGASDLDGGTVYVAEEMGKTNMVYSDSNVKTNAANVQQIKNAYSQALSEWWANARGEIPKIEGASDSGLYTIVNAEALRRGKKFANV